MARDGLRSPRAPHPELPDGWYFDDDEAAKAWDGDSDPVAAVAHQTRLFEEPEILIGRYTPQQIGFGLNFLRKASHSSHVRAFVDSRVPLELRVRGVRAVGQLYEKLLAAIIDPACSSLETSSRGETDSLSDCCFMWWDVWANLPYVLQKQEEAAKASLSYLLEWVSSHPDLVEAGWAAMKQALATGHRLCIEGALHCLGHWQFEESGSSRNRARPP